MLKMDEEKYLLTAKKNQLAQVKHQREHRIFAKIDNGAWFDNLRHSHYLLPMTKKRLIFGFLLALRCTQNQLSLGSQKNLTSVP